MLQELARHVDVPRERICAAGDNHNDMSMLCSSIAGFRVCPSNAIPEVQAFVTSAPGGIVGQGRSSFGVLEGIQRLLSAESEE